MQEHQRTDRGEASGTEKVKEKARQMTDQAESKAEEMASEARDRGEDAMRQGKEKARELGDEASRRARSRAEEQKDRVAGGMRTMADALRQGTRNLPEDGQQYGRFLETVADRVEGASRYIEERDVDGLTQDVQRFARDHTPLFLGGAFTLGLAGARFLKSSGSGASSSRPEPTGTMESAGRTGELRPEQPRSQQPRSDQPGMREPAPPYPRSSNVREAAERAEEEGGYA